MVVLDLAFSKSPFEEVLPSGSIRVTDWMRIDGHEDFEGKETLLKDWDNRNFKSFIVPKQRIFVHEVPFRSFLHEVYLSLPHLSRIDNQTGSLAYHRNYRSTHDVGSSRKRMMEKLIQV